MGGSEVTGEIDKVANCMAAPIFIKRGVWVKCHIKVGHGEESKQAGNKSWENLGGRQLWNSEYCLALDTCYLKCSTVQKHLYHLRAYQKHIFTGFAPHPSQNLCINEITTQFLWDTQAQDMFVFDVDFVVKVGPGTWVDLPELTVQG